MYSLEDYFRAQQVPLQWAPILRALGQELTTSAKGNTESLRSLFRAVGVRFGQDQAHLFSEVTTLVDLNEAFNELWSQTNWGVVDLAEQTDHISIEHRFAPLAESFGAECLGWTTGLLEGFYQSGFSHVGAGEDLRVQYTGQENDGMRLLFKLVNQ
jgi:hypothetical protein